MAFSSLVMRDSIKILLRRPPMPSKGGARHPPFPSIEWQVKQLFCLKNLAPLLLFAEGGRPLYLPWSTYKNSGVETEVAFEFAFFCSTALEMPDVIVVLRTSATIGASNL